MPDNTPLLAIGSLDDLDVQWDAILEWRFPDETALMQFVARLNEETASEILLEEEAKFSVSEKMKIVLLEESVDLHPELWDESREQPVK